MPHVFFELAGVKTGVDDFKHDTAGAQVCAGDSFQLPTVLGLV